MKLLFVRHAKAEDVDPSRWQDDSLRPLTVKGKSRFARSVPGIQRLAPHLDQVFTSPYARALKTAQILCSHVDPREPIIDGRLAGHCDLEDLLELVQSLDASKTYALVGHDPVISQAPAALTNAKHIGDTSLKPGGVALIDSGLRIPEAGKCDLRAVIQPKDLQAS